LSEAFSIKVSSPLCGSSSIVYSHSSITIVVMDPTASVAADINVSSLPPNSFSLVPGLTTATNTAMAPSAATTTLILLSNTQQVINLKLTNTNYLFWHMQMKSYLLCQ